jgi:protein tyrosine/serine phosphatase
MNKSIIALSAAFTFLFSIPSQAEITNLGQATPFIFRGALPTETQDYEMLKNQGVQVILSLLTTSLDIKKEQKIAKQMGIKFVSVPLSGWRSPSNQEMSKIQDVLIHAPEYPVFIHCRHGKDRTGLSIGVYRVRQENWSKEKAYEEMIEWGFKPILLTLTHYFWDHAALDRD